LDLVKDQQHVVLVANTARGTQVLVGANVDAALADDGLEDQRRRQLAGERRSLEEGLESANVVDRQVHDVHQGADERASEGLLGGTRQRTERLAVEASNGSHEAMTSSGEDGLQRRRSNGVRQRALGQASERATLNVYHLEASLDGLGSRVTEERVAQVAGSDFGEEMRAVGTQGVKQLLCGGGGCE